MANDGSPALRVRFGHGLGGLTQGDGEAVVWLHGYAMDSRVWSELWSLLPGFRHIGIDLPGHGSSRPLHGRESLPRIAEDLHSIASAAAARRVIALSFGTMFALELAAIAGEEIDQLLIAAPSVAGSSADPAAQRKNAELQRLYREKGPGSHLTHVWLCPPPDIFTGVRKLNPAMLARIKRIADSHSWDELKAGTLRPVVDQPQSRATIAKIKAQTTIIAGEQDIPVFLKNAHWLKRVIPRADIVHLAGAGHLPLLELPESCAPLLNERLTPSVQDKRQPM